MRAKLLSLATAVPEHELRTEDVIVEATKIFGGRHEDFDRMMPVYANTGINMRYSVCSYDWFREEQGWPERSEAFVTGASHLFGVVSAPRPGTGRIGSRPDRYDRDDLVDGHCNAHHRSAGDERAGFS